MGKKKPRRGEAAGRRSFDSENGPSENILDLAHQKQSRSAAAPTVDLLGFRERLLGARRRLVERIAEDFPADRRFPDSGWTRMLADIHISIAAVDDVIAEGAP